MTDLYDGALVGGSYRIERVLAEGATGVVYKAWDEALERWVALKVLHSHVGDADGERLRREAAALASLRNDHVVGVYAFGALPSAPGLARPGKSRGAAWFAMEFVEGRSLGSLIREHYQEHQDFVPMFRAVQLLRDLSDGLAAVHGAGIVHRDLKPDNVIIEDRTGRAVLVDFGAAVLVKDPGDGRVMGTPYYLAPEAANGAPPAPTMDIYSLGCAAYELLTGRGPYLGSDVPKMILAHQTAPVPKASSFRPGIEHLDALLAQTIAKDPEERPPSAAILSNRFEDHLEPPDVDDDYYYEDPISVVTERPEGGVRILVVDDDPVFARIAARCARLALIGAHAEVSRAPTGLKALHNAGRRRPDIIVLDYLLPDMTGVEVLSRIRAGPDGAHPEVLVASGAVGQAERWRFGILGVRTFVEKPIEFTDLLSVIHGVAARRGWTREGEAKKGEP